MNAYNILRPDVPEPLGVLLAEGAQLPIVDVVQILACIGKGPVPVSPGVLREVLQRLMPSHVEEIEAWIDRAMEAKEFESVFDRN